LKGRTTEDPKQLEEVLKDTEDFPEQSQKLRKRFDPLRRTWKGKVQTRKLAKGERK
jgi:hypothetical protein